eukprot:2533619-Amphidinium_carterae.1
MEQDIATARGYASAHSRPTTSAGVGVGSAGFILIPIQLMLRPGFPGRLPSGGRVCVLHP